MSEWWIVGIYACVALICAGIVIQGIIGLIHETSLEQDIEQLKGRFGKTGRK